MKRTLRRPAVVDGLKWCPSCEQWLSLKKFGVDNHSANGLKCYCKQCIQSKRQPFLDRRKEENRCIVCGKPSDGHMRCAECRDKSNVVNVERIEYRRKNHLCLTCGKALDPDYKMIRCPRCNAGRKKHRDALTNQRLELGLCIRCGKPSKDTALCPVCNNLKIVQNKARVDKAREEGICTRCLSKPADPGFRRCSECRAKTARLEAARHKTHR